MTAPGTTPIPATGWWVKPRPVNLTKATRLSAVLDDDLFDLGWAVSSNNIDSFPVVVALILAL